METIKELIAVTVGGGGTTQLLQGSGLSHDTIALFSVMAAIALFSLAVLVPGGGRNGQQ